MPEGVDQGLTSDAIHLVANERMDRADASLYRHLEIRAIARGVFLLHQTEGLLEVVAALGAQPADRDTALVADAAHQEEHALELLPVRRVGWQIVDGGMQLHRGAHDTLQQRVVQLLRDPRALGQAFFETDVQLPGQLPRAQPVGREREPAAGGDDEETEPGRLPEGRLHHERDRRVGLPPSSISRAAHHAEAIRAGREMRVDRLGGGGRRAPVAIAAVEPVAEPHLLRKRQADPDELERDALAIGGNAKRGGAKQVERDAIDQRSRGPRRSPACAAAGAPDRRPRALAWSRARCVRRDSGSASVRAACFQRCAARQPPRIRGCLLHPAVRAAGDRAPPAGGGSRSPPTASPCCPRQARRSDRAGRVGEDWPPRGPRRSARGPPPCRPTATRRLRRRARN